MSTAGTASTVDTLGLAPTDVASAVRRLRRVEGQISGVIRMLEEGRPDLVVAFPGRSGTAHMMRIARAAGVAVIDLRDQD